MSLFDINEICRLYSKYEDCIDSEEFDNWVHLFADDANYKVIPRENYEKELPLATLDLSSKGMMLDRIHGVRETIYHDPYYQRHVTSLPVIRQEDDSSVFCEANYAVFRTKLSEPSTVFNVGRYFDQIVEEGGALKFKSRTCVYDSEMIPNAIIYPI